MTFLPNAMPIIQAPIRTHWRVRVAFESRIHAAVRAAAEETEAIVSALDQENARLKAEIIRLQTELADARGHLATWKQTAVQAHRELRDLRHPISRPADVPASPSLCEGTQPASTSAAGHDEATCVAPHGAEAGSATSAQA